MKKDASFVEYVVEDLFAYLQGTISARSMFGGYGVYRDGVMFGLVADGALYFKVTDSGDVEQYRAMGSGPFVYHKQGKPQELSYYYIPEEVQENTALFRALAERAFECALEVSVQKKGSVKKVKMEKKRI